jgi:hypothetical protein
MEFAPNSLATESPAQYGLATPQASGIFMSRAKNQLDKCVKEAEEFLPHFDAAKSPGGKPPRFCSICSPTP